MERERGGTAGSQQQMVSGFLPAELSLSFSFTLSALLPHVLSCITRRIMYHLTSASLLMYSIYCLTLNSYLDHLLLSGFCRVNLILVTDMVLLFLEECG